MLDRHPVDREDALYLLHELLGICRRGLASDRGTSPRLCEIDDLAEQLEEAIASRWAEQAALDAHYDAFYAEDDERRLRQPDDEMALDDDDS